MMNLIIAALVVTAALCTGLMYACLAAISSKYSKYEDLEWAPTGARKE